MLYHSGIHTPDICISLNLLLLQETSFWRDVCHLRHLPLLEFSILQETFAISTTVGICLQKCLLFETLPSIRFFISPSRRLVWKDVCHLRHLPLLKFSLLKKTFASRDIYHVVVVVAITMEKLKDREDPQSSEFHTGWSWLSEQCEFNTTATLSIQMGWTPGMFSPNLIKWPSNKWFPKKPAELSYGPGNRTHSRDSQSPDCALPNTWSKDG